MYPKGEGSKVVSQGPRKEIIMNIYTYIYMNPRDRSVRYVMSVTHCVGKALYLLYSPHMIYCMRCDRGVPSLSGLPA